LYGCSEFFIYSMVIVSLYLLINHFTRNTYSGKPVSSWPIPEKIRLFQEILGMDEYGTPERLNIIDNRLDRMQNQLENIESMLSLNENSLSQSDSANCINLPGLPAEETGKTNEETDFTNPSKSILKRQNTHRCSNLWKTAKTSPIMNVTIQRKLNRKLKKQIFIF
jgi:hypothetical protein